MDESKKLNAVIDVIMLAGTILLRNGSEIYRVEDTIDSNCSFTRHHGL